MTELDSMHTDELIELRREARASSNWKLSDEIRNRLDERYVFVFDLKDDNGQYFQEVHYMLPSQFDLAGICEYQATFDPNGEMTSPHWSETNRQRFERINKIKLKTGTNREFVSAMMQVERRSENNFEAWLYSVRCSIREHE